MDVEVRLLHRRGVPAYTHVVALAVIGEPEAVRVEEQALITRQAADRELQTWATTRQRLLSELEHLRVHAHSLHVDRGVRAMQREIAALDRKLQE